MGKIPQGILGGVSGKVGSVVGGGWKGINYIRSKPLSVANPRTVGQVNQRNKMSFMVLLSQAWLAIIVKPLWDRFAQKESGYNAFVSANISNATDEGDGFTDYSLVEISRGKIETRNPNVPSVTAGFTSINVTWATAVTGQQAANDIAYVGLIIEQSDGLHFYEKNNVARSVGTMNIPCVGEDSGYNVYIYLAFKSADGRNVSNTGYAVANISS